MGKFKNLGRSIYYKNPKLRPFLGFIYNKLYLKPKFSGWGMTSAHELPWNDEFDWKTFQKNNDDIKNHFKFNLISGVDQKNMDSLLWRHWIVSYCVRHAMTFSNDAQCNFVECGTGDGITAFFALSEISNTKKDFFFHLYDSWKSMRSQELLESELSMVGSHSNLDIKTTKKNLFEFDSNIIYHQGYIPESLNDSPKSPDSLIFLHVDLNSAKPTLNVLEFFFPILEKGGVILFDDYGCEQYSETKNVIDSYFFDKSGMLLKLPTGQAIYFKK